MFTHRNKVSSLNQKSHSKMGSKDNNEIDSPKMEKPHMDNKEPKVLTPDQHAPVSKPIKEVFMKFLESTSVKGVNKATKSDGITLKILWLFSTLVGLSLGIILICLIMMNYFNYEAVTQISLCDKCTPDFPDITICKLNVFGYELPGTTYSDYIDQIVAIRPNDTLLQELAEQTGYDASDLQRTIFELYTIPGYISNAFHESYFTMIGIPQNRTMVMQFCQWFDWDNLPFEAEKCVEAESVRMTTSAQYPSCYTISVPQQHQNKISATTAILYLHEFPIEALTTYHNEESPNYSHAMGVRVFIHEAGIYPDVQSGFDVGPGQHAKVDIKAIERERLPAPYESCTEDKYIEHDTKAEDTYKYTVHGAEGLCRQKKIIKECQCSHPGLPVTKDIQNQNVSSCYELISGYTSDSLIESVNKLYCMRRILKTAKCDQFDMPCKEKSYEMKDSQVPWPHESAEIGFYIKYINNTDHPQRDLFQPKFRNYDIILEVLETNLSQGIEMLREETLIERNFIQLQVQFQREEVLKRKSLPSLDLSGLLAYLGGTLNLWIGITFFTFIEVLDLLYKIVVILWQQRKKGKNAVAAGS